VSVLVRLGLDAANAQGGVGTEKPEAGVNKRMKMMMLWQQLSREPVGAAVTVKGAAGRGFSDGHSRRVILWMKNPAMSGSPLPAMLRQVAPRTWVRI
jgi:hypothetical protein